MLSGVLADAVADLVGAFETNGWQHVRTDQEQDWVAVRLLRP